MGEECHVARQSVKVSSEALDESLTSAKGGLSGRSNDDHPAQNPLTGACRILHHVLLEHPSGTFRIMNWA
jgi:hypothetical protein